MVLTKSRRLAGLRYRSILEESIFGDEVDGDGRDIVALIEELVADGLKRVIRRAWHNEES